MVSQSGAAKANGGDEAMREEDTAKQPEAEAGGKVESLTEESWAAFEKRWNRLRDEMKEDGWLVRFKT